MGHEHPTRRVTDRSRSGAPAAGSAVRDFFSGDEIFQRLVATADEEFSRSTRLLFLSGIAAGLSIGVSFLARAALSAGMPEGMGGIIANLFYPVGFLLIVMGRYQLFTENTLTPVTLVLTRIASLPSLFRVWGVVLAANLLGAGLCALVLSQTGVFTAEAAEAARGFGRHALETPTAALFWKGIFAGFIVASMVWLMHAARDSASRFLIIFALMFLIPSAELYHCIIGACEALYLVFGGEASLGAAARFFLPVLLGNTAGGVLLVGTLNFAQTREHRYPDRDCRQLELSWREWFLGSYTGRAIGVDVETDDIELPPESGKHDLALDLQAGDHVRGPQQAPLELVMYGDFECPHAKAAAQVIEQVRARFGDEVRYAYRHYPLARLHPHARLAAQAAEAAGQQGFFWDYYDRLFAAGADLSRAGLLEHARALGLEAEAFEAALGSQEVQTRVARDVKSGRESGVQGTPTLFVGGYRYDDDISVGALVQIARYLGVDTRRPAETEEEVVSGSV